MALAGEMFNLIRKPTQQQATQLAHALTDLATRIGPARASQELVPAIVAQSDSPHAERRALVVETCGALLPLLKPGSEGREALCGVLRRCCCDGDVDVKLGAIQRLAGGLSLLTSLQSYPQVVLVWCCGVLGVVVLVWGWD